MSTTPLYIDLSKSTNWIAEDETTSAISGAYEQKPENQPKVQWSLNTIPFSGGMKSLTPQHPDIMTSIPEIEADGYVSTDLSRLLDSDGNMAYLFINSLIADVGLVPVHWVWGGNISSSWRKLLTRGSANPLFNRRHTYFQTQTLHVSTLGDFFDGTVTVNGGVPADNAVFSYDQAAHSVQVYPLAGIQLTTEPKLGLTSFQNYLLFWDESTLHWSSPTNFQDFTPAIGGGGSTRISEAKGKIISIVPNPQGLIVYCSQNMVHVAFSGDSSNPWIFTEIAGSLGVITYNNAETLVSSSETAALQIALTAKGLVAVTSNSVKALPAKLNEMLMNTQVEVKPVNSVAITKIPSTPAGYTLITSKIRKIQLLNNKLFIYCGLGNTLPPYDGGEDILDNRLYIYDLGTDLVTIMEGDYLAAAQGVKTGGQLIPDTFLVANRIFYGQGLIVAVQLNLAAATERERYFEALILRDAEILVGNIQVSRSKTTIIHSVRLDGRLHADDDPEGLKRCRVFAYSKTTMGATNPQEYIYNPADNTYYGYIEGMDLQLEIRGINFYLTGASVEVEVGGEF